MKKKICISIIPFTCWLSPVLAATGEETFAQALDFLGRAGQVVGIFVAFWGVVMLGIHFNGWNALDADKNLAIKIIIIGGLLFSAGPILKALTGV